MATSLAELQATVTADTSDFDSKMDAAGQKVDELGTKAESGAANFGAASAVMAAGALGIGAGMADAIGMAGNFQSSINEIGAVTGATTSELDALSAMALKVGQDTSFSAQEGAQAISELGKAGIPIPDILNGAAMATAALAAAGGVDMPRAAEVMSNAMNVFGLSGDQATNTADTLAAAANASASDVNSLAMGMAQAGPSAAGLGLSLEETVAQLALFSNYGMQGSDAGTSFKTMLASLTPSTKAAREEFAQLGLSTADTANAFFDANGQFVGMEKATSLLYDALAPLTDEQRLVAEETIFGSDASRAAEITFQAQKAAVEGTADGYSDLLDAVQPAGQATDVANAKMAGMNGAIEALSGSIDTAKIAFGMAFLPAIEAVADALAQLVNVFIGLPEPVQQVISFVTAGAAAFLGIGSAIGFVIGPMGAMLAAAAPLAAAIGAIALPLALVVAALAALYIAYQTNFLGFADGVNAAVAGIQSAFTQISAGITALVTSFQSLIASGMDPVSAAVAALSGAFPALSGAFETAGALVQTFITTLQGIATGFQEVITAIQAGDLGGVFQGLFDIALASITGFVTSSKILWDGLWQAFSAIDWGAVSSAILTGLQGISDGLTAWLNTTSTQLLEGMQAAWDAVSAAVGPAWTAIQSALAVAWADILAAVNGALESIKSTVTNAWTSVAESIAVQMATATTTVSTTWNGIVTTLGGILETLKTTVSTAWEAISTTVSTTMTTVQTTLETAWATIQTTVSTALDTIATTVSTEFDNVQAGVAVVWDAITTTISTAWETIQTTVSTAMSTLQTTISTTMTDIQTTVTTAAEDIKTGFVTSITTMKDDAITALGGLKDGIVALFADAASWLVQAGADIIGGLVQGILSQAGAVASAIQSIIPTDIGIDLGGISISNPLTNPFDSGGSSAKPASSGGNRGGGGVSSLSQRASGGPVWGGRMYLVGEDGPELFMPGTSGTIIPNGGSPAPAFAGANPMQGGTYIANVTLRDERDMENYVRRAQRSQRVMAGRGS